jgi:hypothetical protein
LAFGSGRRLAAEGAQVQFSRSFLTQNTGRRFPVNNAAVATSRREAGMFSKINHVAIVSEHYAESALFYQSVFGMRTSDKTRTASAQTVGDGYVGLNINPVGTGAEGNAHLEKFRRTCPLGQHHMADCDGILIDVSVE